jgi:hypothetical protein
MDHSEYFDCSPGEPEHEILISAEYEAGYQARLLGSDEYRTATPSWRSGWSDADHDLQSGVLTEGSSDRDQTEGQWSAFGSGWDARLCDLPFAAQGSEDWKRDWILADIALGVTVGKGRA